MLLAYTSVAVRLIKFLLKIRLSEGTSGLKKYIFGQITKLLIRGGRDPVRSRHRGLGTVYGGFYMLPSNAPTTFFLAWQAGDPAALLVFREEFLHPNLDFEVLDRLPAKDTAPMFSEDLSDVIRAGRNVPLVVHKRT